MLSVEPITTEHAPANEERFWRDADDDALFRFACAIRDSGYGFTTVTPATHLRVNSRAGNAWANDMAGVFGWSRPFRAELLPPDLFALMRAAGVAAPHRDGWRSLVRFSTLDGQLFIHSAFPTDDADAVFFGPDTYRFANAIKTWLSAGPGAILIALTRPEAEVLALDINHAALRMTRINTALAAVTNVAPRHSDLLADAEGLFDLIVANPPYLVDPAQRTYRDGGGPLGIELSLRIVDAALERLAPAGTLLLYTGAAVFNGLDPLRKAAEARLAATDVAWSYREVDPDVFGEELVADAYADADRIAAVVLTVSRLG